MTTPTRVNPNVAPSSSTGPTPSRPRSARRRVAHTLALVVAGSAVAGFLAAVALVAAPVVPATESALTGAVLCGFAIGWALLAGLSTRFTAQPQRWAACPPCARRERHRPAGPRDLGAPRGRLDLAAGPARTRVWMVVRVHRDLPSRPARWLLYPAIGAMGLAAVGGAYQTVGTAADAASIPMPGRLVDVGGHRLHLNCTGTGSPTVVLEAGGGEMAANLGWITRTVARDTTICVYDRAGRGWSEDADTPQDALAISTDLHTLLHNAGVPGPYVMAGHSFGGLYALTYAAHHPDDVAGMVLIDSTSPHPDEAKARPRPERAGAYDIVGRASALTSSARLGLGRVFATSSPLTFRPRNRTRCRRAPPPPPPCEAHSRSTRGQRLDGAGGLPARLADKPLMVLSAGTGNAADWPQKQERLAALSTNSVHRVVDDASHEALVGDENAAATSQAILEVVSAVRTGLPLQR